MSAEHHITFAAKTDIGRERRHNEDGIAAFEFSTSTDSRQASCALFVVSDGMGGHNAGEIASMTAVESMVSSVLRLFMPKIFQTHFYALPEHVYNYHFKKQAKSLSTPNAAKILLRALQRANVDIIDLSRKNPAFFGMGATMTVALLVDRHLTVGNVGDSRCYVFQDDALKQITRDHTIVTQMVELGKLTAEEALKHPGRNFLYKSLGSDDNTQFDVFETELVPPAWVLLSSDGLTNMVPDAEITRTIQRGGQPRQIADRLVRMANRAGGKDNISVIVAKLA